MPDDASSYDKVLSWFDDVEELGLTPPVSQSIVNRLVRDGVIAKSIVPKDMDMAYENQLFAEIAAAGINIDDLSVDNAFKPVTNHRRWWRESGGKMLDRLSQRLNSVAAPSASSQSKEVASGRRGGR